MGLSPPCSESLDSWHEEGDQRGEWTWERIHYAEAGFGGEQPPGQLQLLPSCFQAAVRWKGPKGGSGGWGGTELVLVWK